MKTLYSIAGFTMMLAWACVLVAVPAYVLELLGAFIMAEVPKLNPWDWATGQRIIVGAWAAFIFLVFCCAVFDLASKGEL